MRKPDFSNILKVLDHKRPSRSTLFEYYMNDEVYDLYAGESLSDAQRKDPVIYGRHLIKAFANFDTLRAAVFHSSPCVMLFYSVTTMSTRRLTVISRTSGRRPMNSPSWQRISSLAKSTPAAMLKPRPPEKRGLTSRK